MVRGEVWPGRAGRRRATAVHAACREEGSTAVSGAGHGEERTPNMDCMFVTLEVSKLSGWLNADADCRESKGGHVRCGTTCGLGGARHSAASLARTAGGRRGPPRRRRRTPG